MLKISEIYIYPIKSLGGISLSEAKVEARGLQYDRRWMLTDDNGKFVSQRDIPEMALLGTALTDTHLKVFAKNRTEQSLEIPLEIPMSDLSETPVEVWGTHFTAARMPKEYGDWFSRQLGQPLHLAYMHDAAYRPTSADYAKGHEVSFADGYPVLIIGQAALDALNQRLAVPLPMDRFRPNLVFTGGFPHEEDELGDFFIGNVPFRGVKRCGRCEVTTTDQKTAVRGAEPLKTLASYRLSGKSINFGENLVWTGSGDADWVRLGDAIEKANPVL